MPLWIIKYLVQAGPTHPKHGGGLSSCPKTSFPIHPLLSFIVHYSIVIPTVFLAQDIFFIPKLSSSLSAADETHLAQQEETTQRQMHI